MILYITIQSAVILGELRELFKRKITLSNSEITLLIINSLFMKNLIKKPKNLIFCLSSYANCYRTLARKANIILSLTIRRCHFKYQILKVTTL